MATLTRQAAESLSVESLAVAALEAPRCECLMQLRDQYGQCVGCGKEIRALGTFAREFRKAAYTRRLAWARGAGLDPSTGFRGLSDELGPNPELRALDAAIQARVEVLPSLADDPLLGRVEPPPCWWRPKSAARRLQQR